MLPGRIPNHRFLLALFSLLTVCSIASAQYKPWTHQAPIHILTTPQGADLAEGVVLKDFPLLIRLDRDHFDFAQARPGGEDVRFSMNGQALAYEIDHWDATQGRAAVWVRVPRIEGNRVQALQLHWGNPDAESESDGKQVFNQSNGYLTVMHMNDPLTDSTGQLSCTDAGTTTGQGPIGPARNLAEGQGIHCGEQLTHFPTGSTPHSTEVWFRTEKPNARLVGWGTEEGQGKVVMHFRSPPHIDMDCYFSDGNVSSEGRIGLGEWVHAAHTYRQGEPKLYINGQLDGETNHRATPLAINRPARMWIGGWYNHYQYEGQIDEVRISNVTRSADWLKLQYENQKPLSTAVGHPVRPGNRLAVVPGRATVAENGEQRFEATAEGALKVAWILKSGDQQEVVSVDRHSYPLRAPRVTADESLTLQFQAIYPDEVRLVEIPITVRDTVAEPEFRLTAPAQWDGRSELRLTPEISNLAALQEQSTDDLNIHWSIDQIATLHTLHTDHLQLHRAQNSGPLVVTATIDNGGQATKRSVTIEVTEPTSDAWVERPVGPDEKPVDHQFYARDDQNRGMLHYNGQLDAAADEVFLNVYADDQFYRQATASPDEQRRYRLSVPLEPGLITYRLEFGHVRNGQREILHRVGDLVCGDAYIIQGQSNAEAFDMGRAVNPYTSRWIRSFGSPQAGEAQARTTTWGHAVSFDRDGWDLQIGYWGIELGRKLVERHQVPIFIINGAKGGTRIDQHQRNPDDPTDVTTIYGRLLWRLQQARLTHGVRAVLWHQGENDQGAAGPTGGYGWESYQDYFVQLAAAWKQDYPNLQDYYVFQIWPRACAMGKKGSDNMLREVQRQLPELFSNLHTMSTLGIRPGGGCHYPAEGYAQIAKLIYPLVARDHYGANFFQSITAPNLVEVRFSNDRENEIELVFDQPVDWQESAAELFQFNTEGGKVISGQADGRVVTLQTEGAGQATHITYIDGRNWNEKKRPLRGKNGIAAFSFCQVPIE
ncbi:MAG: DUF2341 domain-containing protein [Mariniblastus sp.]|nr:DUF2341 domain-containing protein [Mariniblastus sp.]